MVEDSLAAPTPVPNTFLICDQVSADVMTGKITAVGIFSVIWAQSFPANHASSFLYARLVNCEGQYTWRVDCARLGEPHINPMGERVFDAGGEFLAEDRHAYSEWVLALPVLRLQAPGEYEFRLWMNDCFISHVRINAIQRIEEAS